ncbi:LamG-like jellyroll fold domain-containing protein, partial [Nanoarchaeota archaeon]
MKFNSKKLGLSIMILVMLVSFVLAVGFEIKVNDQTFYDTETTLDLPVSNDNISLNSAIIENITEQVVSDHVGKELIVTPVTEPVDEITEEITEEIIEEPVETVVIIIEEPIEEPEEITEENINPNVVQVEVEFDFGESVDENITEEIIEEVIEETPTIIPDEVEEATEEEIVEETENLIVTPVITPDINEEEIINVPSEEIVEEPIEEVIEETPIENTQKVTMDLETGQVDYDDLNAIKKVKAEIKLKDSKNKNLNVNVKFFKKKVVQGPVLKVQDDDLEEVQPVDGEIEEDTYELVEVEFDDNDIESVQKIEFNNINISSATIDLRVEDVEKDEKDKKDEEKAFVKQYAIDPTGLEFEDATVTVIATGRILEKCKDWNFDTQTCEGTWETFKTGLVPGQEYTFTLTADDPGFGEIIEITNAMHLDENKDLISNIYDETIGQDDLWSEPIYHNEFVRITFEENLTSENDITVFVRNTQSLNTLIEVYYYNSSEKITEFPIITQEEYYTIYLTDMIGNNDMFDLKIINQDNNDTAFLEFDHIIDPTAIGTPSATLSFFMSDTFGGGDKGVDGGEFDEVPIQLNDYGQTTEKCEVWDCTEWDSAIAKRGYYCDGGWNCTSWNGVTCETFDCLQWDQGGLDQAVSYCTSGWACQEWNDDYCGYWDCSTWINTIAKEEIYCDGGWDCTEWNNGVCGNWTCTSYTSAGTGKVDQYCSGVWDCTEWNGDVCGNWNCTEFTPGTTTLDYYCADGWSCTAWNGDVCDNWDCITPTAGTTERDMYCDSWNCSTWDEDKMVCQDWDCLEWITGSAADLDFHCTGEFNCTTWKSFTSLIWEGDEFEFGGNWYDDSDNFTGIINITAINDNTNIAIVCDSGNCTDITTNYTTIDLTSGQYYNIFFECPSGILSNYTAVYNITSDEDTTVDQLDITCHSINPFVIWDESSLNIIGEIETNIQGSETIFSEGSNDGVIVTCASGDCDTITDDFTDGTNFSYDQTALVTFDCGTTEGNYSAIFEVNSTDDNSSDSIIVNCTNEAHPKVYVAHPDPIDKDQIGKYAVIIKNPSRYNNITVTKIYINATTSGISHFNAVSQGAGKSYPLTGWSENGKLTTWSGTEIIETNSATAFWVGIDGLAVTETFTITYEAIVDGLEYSSPLSLTAESLNGNLQFTSLAFDMDTYPMYVVEANNSQEKTYTIALEEDANKLDIPIGVTLTITLPNEFTSITDIGGTGWGTADVNGNTISVNTTQLVKDLKINYSFNATAPSTNGLYIFNANMSGSGARALLEGVVIVSGDIIPPAPITNLANQSQSYNSIYWNWTNPLDSDFSHAILYLNGTNIATTSNNYYLVTGLNGSTNYMLTVHTKDDAGNVNNTDVNSSAITEIAPNVAISLVDPNSNTNFLKDSFNEFSVNVSCFIEDCGEINVSLDPISYGSTSSQVSQSSDDAEEYFTGGMTLTGSSLDMPSGSVLQHVGLRFQNINIPQGATIVSAYVDFEGRDSLGNVSLNFYGESNDDASTFTTSTNDITNRTMTSASVTWDVPLWTDGEHYQSDDLSSIIQEIVNREGWVANNSMAIVINGTDAVNFRDADSYDAAPSSAALLFVNYSTGSPDKVGLISTVAGTLPFYTNKSSNPFIINLSSGESQIVTFFVNATGTLNTTHEFFAFANLADDPNIFGITETINITIIPDVFAPASITNLNNQSSGSTWIYWNWTNPDDVDFSQSIIYINSINVANTSNGYYNATSLTPETDYTITVHTKDTSGNVNNTDVNSTAVTLPDVYSPVISNVQASSITNESATITWTTNENANSSVNYGINLSLDGSLSMNDSNQSHSMGLTGLSSNTSYYYNVTSCDVYGNCQTNGIYNFTTLLVGDQVAPTISDLVISTPSSEHIVDQNLTASWTATDLNNDNIINITDWRINGTSIAILNMPFENHSNANITAIDYSTNGYNGTVVNLPWLNASNCISGGCYNFSGSSDYIEVLDSEIGNPVGEFTLTAWATISQTGIGNDNIISKHCNYRLGYSLEYDWTNNYTKASWGNGEDWNLITGSSWDLNEWHFVVLRYNGSDVEYFDNAQSVGTSPTGTPQGCSNDLWIGGAEYYGQNWGGLIDEVKIFNGSLSLDQIVTMYNDGVPKDDLIVSQETLLNENWTVAVTPNDGGQDGITVISDILTITDLNDTTAPGSVTGLANQSAGYNWIYWTWTNPEDADFYRNVLYINGEHIGELTGTSLNATGLNTDTSYTITLHTKDTIGNVNNTDVNDTATTLNQQSTIPLSITCNGTSCNTTFETDVEINCSGSTDDESDTITYKIEAYYNYTNPDQTNAIDFENYESFADTDIILSGSIWSNTAGDTCDWQVYSNNTESGSTGPSLDNTLGTTSGKYLYVETSPGYCNINGDTSILESDNITTGTKNTIVSFWYHMYGIHSGTLYLDVYNGTWNNAVWSISGEQHTSETDPYTQAIVDLSEYSGTIKTRFRFVALGNYRGDIAIDDINVTTTDLDVGPNWINIGNHTNGTTYIWDISNIATQNNVDLKCTAIDIDGSNTYSNNYDPLFNLTIYTDVTPPASVINLNNQSRSNSWIYWNWTNPTDPDFDENIIFKDGINVANTSNNYYNMTGLNSDTSYTITIHSIDNIGNINNTDINNTVSTINLQPTIPTSITCNGTDCNNTYETDVEINCSGSIDSDSDVITYFVEAYYTPFYEADQINAIDFEDYELYLNYDVTLSGSVWSNLDTDTCDWQTDSGGTLSGSTGPDIDNTLGNTTGEYLYVETSPGYCNTGGDTAILESDNITAGTKNTTVSFWYHMYGEHSGTLNLDVYNGTWNNAIWTISGQQHANETDPYTEALVDLSDYSGTIKTRFRFVATGNYRGDIAIDDINVTTIDSGINATWSDIGNHTNGTTYVWDISDIPTQSNVDLKCKAIDLTGSNTYSDYYNPPINLDIFTCVEDWQVQYTVCNATDDKTKYYLDQNTCGTTKDLPGDNNTIESCDYDDLFNLSAIPISLSSKIISPNVTLTAYIDDLNENNTIEMLIEYNNLTIDSYPIILNVSDGDATNEYLVPQDALGGTYTIKVRDLNQSLYNSTTFIIDNPYTINLSTLDSNEDIIDCNLTVIDHIENPKFELEITEFNASVEFEQDYGENYKWHVKLKDHEIQEIVFNNIKNLGTNDRKIKIDQVPNTPTPVGTFEEAYAIDPSEVNFTDAIVTVNATGTKLYKCRDWNFSTQSCEGTWSLLRDDLVPGQLYNITITPDDPGFGEILDILTVKSSPSVNGNWTVLFNTTGTANLTIRAVDGTTMSNETEDEDLKFLELYCGTTLLDHDWINNSVFIQDYSCNATGQEISKVISSGEHHLLFTFGDQSEYAHNDAVTLLITGTTELCGTVTAYDKVIVENGGTLSVCAYNGTAGTGYVNLSLGEYGNFTLNAGGKVDALGKGSLGGNGTTETGAADSVAAWQGTNGNNLTVGIRSTAANGGAGGGGRSRFAGLAGSGGSGSFGGTAGTGSEEGGSNEYGGAGSPYGSVSSLLLKIGSGGGGGAGDTAFNGGSGGGGIKIDVQGGVINIQGEIDADGNPGVGDVNENCGASGAGSGGHIILMGKDINISSSNIHSLGGSGGDCDGVDDACGSGGAGGGRIAISYTNLYNNSLTYSLAGGTGGTQTGCDQTPAAGTAGTIYIQTEIYDVSPIVTLDSPVDTHLSTDTQNINFTCNVTDDYNLDNVTFYWNYTGIWQANGSITATSNDEQFTFERLTIPDGYYNWNCYACDNSSQCSFADSNRSITMAASNMPPTDPTSLTCDGEDCNGSFYPNVILNCSGSTDAENNSIDYTIEASYFDVITSDNKLPSLVEIISNYNFIEQDQLTDAFTDLSSWTNGGAWVSYTGTAAAQCSAGGGCTEANANLTLTNAIDLSNCVPGSAWFSFTIQEEGALETDDCLYFALSSDGTTFSSQQEIFCDDSPTPDNNITIESQYFTDSFKIRFRANPGAWETATEYGMIDDLLVHCDIYQASNQTNSSYESILNINDPYDEINNISIKIEVDSFNPEASVIQSTSDPDLMLEMYNGTEYIEIGNFNLPATYTSTTLDTTNNNFTLSTSDSSILTAWETAANQDIRIKSIGLDFYNTTVKDKINYTSVWVTFDGKNWHNIGQHDNVSTLDWYVANITEQSDIDLRCHATDPDGSNLYSGYYDPLYNLSSIFTLLLENPEGDDLNFTVDVITDYDGLVDFIMDVNNEDTDQIIVIGYNNTGNNTVIFKSITNVTHGSDTYAISAPGMIFYNLTFQIDNSNGTHLLKCEDWNMSTLLCNDDESWDTYQLLTMNQPYNVTINSTDPGFIELNVADVDILYDGYADEANPGLEYGASNDMIMANYSSGNSYGLMLVNITKIPDRVYIDYANLSIRVSSETLDGSESIEIGTYLVYPNFTWTEGTGNAGGNTCTGTEFCWNNMPDSTQYNHTVESALVIADGGSSQFYMLNITNIIDYGYQNNNDNVSIYIKPTGTNVGDVSNNDITFDTKESVAARRPQITIQYHTVPDVNSIIPTQNSNYNLSNTVQIKANVTDALQPLVNISTVLANITLPNGTIEQIVLSDAGSDLYNNSFTSTTLTGRYNITIIANNTDGYVNNTQTSYFNVNDVIEPVIVLNSPANSLETTDTTFNFNWTAIDDYDATLVCNLTIDASVNISNIDSTNNAPTNYTVQGFDDGTHYWNVTCQDDSANLNTSETRSLTVDTTAPIISIITPLDEDLVGWDVLLKANVTDIDVGIHSVWYEIRNGSSTTSTLIETDTMLNIGDIFNATLNTNETWPYDTTLTNTTNLTLIVYANDTLGNTLNSSTTFILDNTMPGVQFVAPTQAGSFYNSNFNLEIYLSNHKLNYSYYNITNASGEVLTNEINLNQASYTWTDLINTSNLVEGNYTIFVHAEDWSQPTHNINNKTSWFYVDVTAPNATVETGGWITPTPVNNSFTSTQTQTFNMTCDEQFPDTIWIDFNGTIDSTPTGGSGIYYWWTIPSLEGTYDYTGYCNDTASNQHQTETRILNVDITEPIIELNNPINTYNSSSHNLTFDWTINDNYGVNLLCNLTIDNVIGATNVNSNNGQITSYNVTDITSGHHYWNVTCQDNAGNVNTSTTNSFRIFYLYIFDLNINPDLNIIYFNNYNYTVQVVNSTSIDHITISYDIFNAEGDTCNEYYVNGICAGDTPEESNMTYYGNNLWVQNLVRPDSIYPQIEFADDTLYYFNEPNFMDIYQGEYHIFKVINNFTIVENSSFWIEFDTRDTPSSTKPLRAYIFDNTTDITTFQTNWLNDANGELVAIINPGDPKHHTHTSNSSHYLIPLTANEDGSIGTNNLDINNQFWLVLYVSTNKQANAWNLSYINENLCNTTNWWIGVQSGWTTTPKTTSCPNVHFHTARYNVSGSSDGVNATVTVRDNEGEINSTNVLDFFGQIPNLAPIPNLINMPVAEDYYKCPLNITWNNFIDPNDDTVTYDIILLNSDLTVNSTLNTTTNNYYNWDCSGYSEGNYSLKINGTDTGGLYSISSLGGNFTIDRISPSINLVNPTKPSGIYSQNYITANVSTLDQLSYVNNITIYLYNTTGIYNQVNNNGSQYLYNFTSLPDGIYYLNSSAYDRALNYNTSVTLTYTLDTKEPLWSDNQTIQASGIIYHPGTDYQFNITWDEENSLHTILFENNFTGSIINSTPTDNSGSEYYYDFSSLAVGTYIWKSYANDTAGNLNVTDQWLFTVVQNTSTCSLTFNETSPIIYENALIVSCGCTNPETTPKLYRNGTDVTSEIDQGVILGADTYEYICNISETQNYTSGSDTDTFQITQATSTVNLTLNNIDNNITVESGDYVNLSAYLIYPTGLINLYQDNTQINSGTNYLNNYTQYIVPATHNITLLYPTTQNYSESTETHFIIVEDTTAPNLTIITPLNQDIVGWDVLLKANVTDLNLHSVWYEIRNGSTTSSTLIESNVMLNIDDLYNATLNTNETWPYNSVLTNTTNLTLIVYANDTSGNLFNQSTTFILDNTKPGVQFVAPTQAGSFYN